MLNNNGPSRDPWATPALTHFYSEKKNLNLYTLATLLQIRLVAVVQKPQSFSLANKRLWLTLSNALLRSTTTTARQSSVIFKMAVKQE